MADLASWEDREDGLSSKWALGLCSVPKVAGGDWMAAPMFPIATWGGVKSMVG